MANEQNLNPINSEEMARDYQQRSVEARKRNSARKKTIKETLDILLECKPTDKDLALMRAQGVDVDNDATYRQAIAFSIVNRAMKGNPRAFELIRDTVGEKPVEKIEQTNIDVEYAEAVEYVKKLMEQDGE